jgi:hypothetical protein
MCHPLARPNASISPVPLFGAKRSVRTSQMATLLQMVDTLPPVAFAHLVPHQPRHHALDPLLPNNGILRSLERFVIVVVDALEGGSDLGLLREKEFGLGGGHCGDRERCEQPKLLVRVGERKHGCLSRSIGGVRVGRCAGYRGTVMRFVDHGVAEPLQLRLHVTLPASHPFRCPHFINHCK